MSRLVNSNPMQQTNLQNQDATPVAQPTTNTRLVALENQLRSIEHELRAVAEQQAPPAQEQLVIEHSLTVSVIDALRELKITLEQAIDQCIDQCSNRLDLEQRSLQPTSETDRPTVYPTYRQQPTVQNRQEEATQEHKDAQQTFTVDAGPFNTLTEITQLEHTLQNLTTISTVNLRGFAGSRAHLEIVVDNPSALEQQLYNTLTNAQSIQVDQIAHHTTIDFASTNSMMPESELSYGR